MGAVTLLRVRIGPWGGTGGDAWDEGGDGAGSSSYTGIRSICIGSTWCVHSMLFEYDRNGESVKGKQHGEARYSGETEMTNFPTEFLTHIRGSYDDYLRLLEFKTNRGRTLGPYGARGVRNDTWRPFEVSLQNVGFIIGFGGRSGSFIDALSVYVAVWNPDRFYQSMRNQGVLAYRMPPLSLNVQALQRLARRKKEEEKEESPVRSSSWRPRMKGGRFLG